MTGFLSAIGRKADGLGLRVTARTKFWPSDRGETIGFPMGNARPTKSAKVKTSLKFNLFTCKLGISTSE